jgi:hypothetical protein
MATTKYRTKSVPVNAEQFTSALTPPKGVYIDDAGQAWVSTRHSRMTPVTLGDWIVSDADGFHYYSIGSSTFTTEYELDLP